MPQVVALYRYPIKGFSPERCEYLQVLADGRVAGDRVLGFRFANATVVDDAWGSKHDFVALVNTPGLAKLTLCLNPSSLQLQLSLEGQRLLETGLDTSGRKRMAQTIADYVCQCPNNPLSAHPERLPLSLVGDGITPRYQDNPAGHLSLHSRGSLTSVALAIGHEPLDERRFRSNIVLDGLAPWQEQVWLGRSIAIGTLRFTVAIPKTRCLAIDANPCTGERDLPLLKTLSQHCHPDKPTFAVGLQLQGTGGYLQLGDEVRLLD